MAKRRRKVFLDPFFDKWHLTTDADRLAIRLSRVHVPSVPPPTCKMALVIEADTMRHRLNLFIAGQRAGSALPHGKGTDIYVAYTPEGVAAPADFAAYKFLENTSASSYLIDFDDPALGGMTAHYVLTWVASNGSKGPQSGPFSKTIPQV